MFYETNQQKKRKSMETTNRKNDQKKKKEREPANLSSFLLSFSFDSHKQTNKKCFFFLKPLLVIITRIRGIADFLLTSLCVCVFF